MQPLSSTFNTQNISHSKSNTYLTMAYKASSFLALVLISSILLAITWQAAARHNIVPKNSNTQDKKEPQWLFKSDGPLHIPGIGRVTWPPQFGVTPQNPYTGVGGGAGSGSPGGYVPGGDDTIVPNPGFEVPNPGSEGGVPAPVNP